MVRCAATGFVVSMLLTTVAALLMLSGTVHAQQAPRHVFSGAVRNAGTPVHQGQVSFLDMSGQEVATGNISGGRYKIGVVEPAGRNYSGQTFRITVRFQNRIYERGRPEKWQAGRVTVLDLNFGDSREWKWHGAPSQDRQQEDQRRMDQNDEDRDRRMEMDEQRMEREDEESRRRMEMDEQRMDMEQQRRGSEEELRREQMEMERERMERDDEMREKEGEKRMEMERQRMESEGELRREQMEMERQRMERDDEMREKEGKERMEMERQRMEMERQRMGRGQPGVQPMAGERPKGGPSRGLFSNRKAGEATSGIDNIMDPGTLTIIGIVLTVLTTGMTLFKGD